MASPLGRYLGSSSSAAAIIMGLRAFPLSAPGSPSGALTTAPPPGNNKGGWALRELLGASQVVLGAAALGGLFLALDHYTHNNRAYLRRRIRRVLVAGPRDGLLPQPLPFPALPQAPFPMHEAAGRPLLVIGAAGSGKSTQMGELARDFQSRGVPVLYVRARRANRRLAAAHRDRESGPQVPALSVAAHRFFEALGYPTRPSILSQWLRHRMPTGGGSTGLWAAPPNTVAARYKEAISDLFAVCDELYRERKADPRVPVADRRPVVLSDELHDLLLHRHNNGGGKGARLVVAASGGELPRLNKPGSTSTTGGGRVFPYMQPDPPERDVRERLAERGYDPATVDLIVATCGTRVRLLTPFLESRLADPSSALEPLRISAEWGLAKLMTRCPEDERATGERDALFKLLDRLAESPSASEPVERFPRAVQDPFPSHVLVRGLDETASFQTEAVRQAWKRVRGRYVESWSGGDA
jgi:hypothetical protein